MKKYIVFSVAIATLSCNQPATQTLPASPTLTVDTIKKNVDAQPTELLQVSSLSPEELKDDSVFADGSKPTSWDIAGINDVKGLKLFIKQLQQWIVMNDKESLAGVVKYPLSKTIKTKENLIANYDKFFTKEVKLSFATINFSQLFRNGQGVMTNGGKVWLNQEGKSFKIIAINP